MWPSLGVCPVLNASLFGSEALELVDSGVKLVLSPLLLFVLIGDTGRAFVYCDFGLLLRGNEHFKFNLYSQPQNPTGLKSHNRR